MAIFILNGKGSKKGVTAQRRNGAMATSFCLYAFAPLRLFVSFEANFY
jgi:hypothetical protein